MIVACLDKYKHSKDYKFSANQMDTLLLTYFNWMAALSTSSEGEKHNWMAVLSDTSNRGEKHDDIKPAFACKPYKWLGSEHKEEKCQLTHGWVIVGQVATCAITTMDL